MRDVKKAAKSQADNLMKLGGAVTSRARKSPVKKRTLRKKK